MCAGGEGFTKLYALSVDTAFVVADLAAGQAAGGGELLPSLIGAGGRIVEVVGVGDYHG